MAMPIWLLGTVGIVAMEASYVPQIVRLARVGRAEQLSPLFPALNLAGRLAALAYSVLIGQPVFGIGFFCGALLRGTLLVQILVLRRRTRDVAAAVALRMVRT